MNVIKIKKQLFNLILILIVVLIPLMFNFIFSSNYESKFLFIESNISASDWFAFWISYLSFIITAFLAFAANQLTKQIENSRIEEKANQNKSSFEVKNISVYCDEHATFEFDICLSLNVQFLNNVKIHDAEIKYNNNQTIKLYPKESSLKGCRYKLQTEPTELLEKEIETINKWLNYHKNMISQYEEAVFTVLYSYEFEGTKHLKWCVKSTNTITKTINDPSNRINIKIIDTGIKTYKN